MTQARAAGEIMRAIDPERLGRTIYTGFLGAPCDWACGDSGDADFVRTAEMAVLAPAAAFATNRIRGGLVARLATAMSPPAEPMAV